MEKLFLYNNDAPRIAAMEHMLSIVMPDYDSETKELIKLEYPMQASFTFSTGAEWKELLNISLPGALNTAMAMTGNKIYNAGTVSNLFFDGSQRISISQKIRAKGDDPYSPEKIVRLFSNMCAPPRGSNIDDVISAVTQTVKSGAHAVLDAMSDLNSGEFLGAIRNFMNNIASSSGNDVVYVSFGNFLSGMFVVTGATYTYSNEFLKIKTPTGFEIRPLYVDIDLTFQSYSIPTQGNFRSVDVNGGVMIGNKNVRIIGKKNEDKSET